MLLNLQVKPQRYLMVKKKKKKNQNTGCQGSCKEAESQNTADRTMSPTLLENTLRNFTKGLIMSIAIIYFLQSSLRN